MKYGAAPRDHHIAPTANQGDQRTLRQENILERPPNEGPRGGTGLEGQRQQPVVPKYGFLELLIIGGRKPSLHEVLLVDPLGDLGQDP